MKVAGLIGFALVAGLLGQTASAEEFTVKMLNKGEKGAMVFEPDLIRAKIGDTVRFVAVDKGHNAETVPGMLPDGAESLAGKPNEEIILTLDAEGIYGIRCKPHYGLGMVALIIAGEPVNLQAAEKVKAPGKAGKLFKELLAEAEK